jgi:hypothetical protein
MAQLTTYVNNMFATCDDMETALSQAAIIAGGSDNPAAVHTAVHMVLNTAIRMHNAALSAVNKPLIELIDARVDARVGDAARELREDLYARVGAAVRELREDLYSQVQQAVEDYDHTSVIQSWMEDNLSAEDIMSGRSFTISFD